ncbi:hypothetical protein [Roseibium aggregatum]|uniref:hypothetical protein n=1 Tax=Roseibium aggregatum TaxID=187304 RepID=UPI001E5B579F|nr:hypothetical protein [Roseibium aggregatum]UES49914.1 hypothetical protein GFK88_09985 [Roseibium aggregatum]
MIAALFGGFMIAWLVSAEEVEFITASNSVVLVTIDLRVIGDVEKGGIQFPRWIDAIVAGSESEGCTPGVITELFDRRTANFIPCQHAQRPSISAGGKEWNIASFFLMQENGEKCAERGENARPNNFSLIQRSLSIELAGMDGIEIIGYSTLRPSILAAVGIRQGEGFSVTGNPNCGYGHLNEALYAVGLLSVADTATKTTLDVKILTRPNEFAVLNKASVTSPGSLSLMTDVELFDAAGDFRHFGDTDVFKKPRLAVAICFHEAEVASCLRGEGPLDAGSTITLSRGPVSW